MTHPVARLLLHQHRRPGTHNPASPTLSLIEIVHVQSAHSEDRRLVISGKGVMAVGEGFGSQPVVESSFAVLSLSNSTYPVALEV